MIVGTAGHIDHGKTTLVRALTGVDTDRLPEEKQRGISIELGYAFMDVPESDPTQRIGFIDVPGHERLVHTMIAGATGIDFALLLVAADDGVMPQTREHLAVLSLLGLRRGAVALTKIDRVEACRLNTVAADIQDLLQGSALLGAPVLPVSASTGQGVENLRAHLFSQARRGHEHARASDAFRLAVDRSFTLDGVGTVVTGTVHSGQVRIGDELHSVPGEHRARVRSLHAQNQAVTVASAGQRCAVGLAGIERQHITRGQWLCTPDAASSGDRLDVELTLWAAESKPLRSGQQVHVHLGAASSVGSVAVLDRVALMPGETGRVQLVLPAPLGAWHGDRVVLRDAAAARTLAGGTVLDPAGPVRYRRTAQRLSELDALSHPDPAERLARLLAVSPAGVDLRRHAAAQGAPLPALPADALSEAEGPVAWALGGAQAAQARQRVLDSLTAFHEGQPEELGPDSARLRRLALPRMPEPLWRVLLSSLKAEGRVLQRGAFVHLPEHGVRLSATEERIAQKVAVGLVEAGFEGAWVRDLARDAGEPEPLVRVTLARLAQRGELHQVVRDLYYPLPTVQRLSALARDVANANDGVVTAARFRDATQLGRKRAIQILEHFDRIGLLRRVGDLHKLRQDSSLLLEAA